MSRQKVVCLVSGGIDSPVACALIARVFDVIPIHFCLFPYTCEDNFYTAVDILRDLQLKFNFEQTIVFPWSKILRRILKDTGKYACVMCRRGMMRVAELICDREEAKGIVTGESLGQKASQTVQNLQAVSRGIKYPIIRPLLTMDKLEIEKLSKRSGLWREVHAGCCYATPHHPKTTVKPEAVEYFETRLRLRDLIESEFDKRLELRTWKEDLKGFLESLAA